MNFLQGFISAGLDPGGEQTIDKSLLLLLLDLGEELRLGLLNLGLPGGEPDLGGIPPLLGHLGGGLGLGRWILADGRVALKHDVMTREQ